MWMGLVFLIKHVGKDLVQEKTKTKETYYSLIEQSARSGLFQILGHIDAMKGFYPEFSESKLQQLSRP